MDLEVEINLQISKSFSVARRLVTDRRFIFRCLKLYLEASYFRGLNGLLCEVSMRFKTEIN